MGLTVFAEETSVEVQMPVWSAGPSDQLRADQALDHETDLAIGRLYKTMDLEYDQLKFGSGIKRTPLKENKPI